METSIIYIVGGLVALFLFIFIAKRVLRLAIKLVLVGVVLVALLAGAGYGWWNGWFDSQTKSPRKPGPTRTASPR
ncbi:MAG TPA: hypothetical protein VN643_20185 [Pyrinomonadaceae bacterium]|nr:hypothetical protein [Pyrinomonadaceae bacterium]